MPSLKDLKNRIESVKSTRKITKAMQMVAAAKLRRAQEAAEMARPYAERFNAVMAQLSASVGSSDSAPMGGGLRVEVPGVAQPIEFLAMGSGLLWDGAPSCRTPKRLECRPLPAVQWQPIGHD